MFQPVQSKEVEKASQNIHTLRTDNIHLYATKTALLQIPKFKAADDIRSFEESLLQAIPCLNIAFTEMHRFAAHNRKSGINKEQQAKLSTLFCFAIQQAVIVSEGFYHLADKELSNAHENESYFVSALEYLTLSLDKYSRPDIDYGERDQMARILIDEFGLNTPTLSNGFGSAKPVEDRSEVIAVFDEAIESYRKAQDNLNRSLYQFDYHYLCRIFCRYDNLLSIAQVLEPSKEKEANLTLELVRDQVFKVEQRICRHLEEATRINDFYRWMGGENDHFQIPFPREGIGLARYNNRTPKDLLIEVLQPLGYNPDGVPWNEQVQTYGYGRYFNVPEARKESLARLSA